MSTKETSQSKVRKSINEEQEEQNVNKKAKLAALHHANSDPGNQNSILMWFRMDLRIKDNIAFYRASLAAKVHNIPLLALYVISPQEWKRHDVSPLRVDFWLRNLVELKKSLDKLNIPLIIQHSDSSKNVPQIVTYTAKTVGALKVYLNKEYEVNELKRDQKTAILLGNADLNGRVIDLIQCDDQCVVPPNSVFTKEGKVYKVFTPFKNSWYVHIMKNLQTLKPGPSIEKQTVSMFNESKNSISSFLKTHSEIPTQIKGFELDKDKMESLKKMYPEGETNANQKLVQFLTERGKKYKVDRDLPFVDGTSGLSPYLAAGIISPRVCLFAALEQNNNRIEGGSEGLSTWISEICWRDFYKNILVNFPQVCKNKPFKLETDRVPWIYDDDAFDKWKEGKTGYPIVDAGMRQLKATGWMHNRLRMITGMFLTKDLLIDWRKGEKYFMESLIDGDFSANNGGWQWVASTGTDAVPYFRVFNPISQSEKFDKDGKYIRKWVSELASVKGKAIHDPYSALPPVKFAQLNYPKPIVDHKMARERFITAFKKATSG